MAYQVFISHSTKNADIATSMKSYLEARGIMCWKAPEDIQPGEVFADAIWRGITECPIMVLIFSKDSSESGFVLSEINIATDQKMHVIPFRIEDIQLSGAMAFYLSTKQWVEALANMEKGFADLHDRLVKILGTQVEIPTHQNTQPEIRTAERQKSSPDKTKYVFDGSAYGKGRLVLAIVKKHIELNPGISFQDLGATFPKACQGSSGVFTALDEANKIYLETGHKRHFLDPEDIINLNGQKIAVSNQWGKGNIDKFIVQAQGLGFEISIAG